MRRQKQKQKEIHNKIYYIYMKKTPLDKRKQQTLITGQAKLSETIIPKKEYICRYLN